MERLLQHALSAEQILMSGSGAFIARSIGTVSTVDGSVMLSVMRILHLMVQKRTLKEARE